jgi:hypothetical protein
MGTKGIQLVFDEHGEPRVAQPQEKTEECLAGVQCRYAEIEQSDNLFKLICLESGKPQSPFGFVKCPRKRWAPIEGLGTNKTPINFRVDENRCYTCMTTSTVWQLKPPKGEKDDHWTCYKCHPPATGIPKKKIVKRKRR